MSTPFIGEIRLVGFNFAPVGWNFCDGTLLSIADYSPLYNLIGTTYGGNGQTTFAVPDLRGRVPIHMNGTYVIGSVAGAESVTIVITDMPSHSHQMQGSASAASSTVPTSNAPGAATINIYAPPSSTVQTASITTNSPASGGLPHDNIQPYVALNYVIALDGIYPSQG